LPRSGGKTLTRAGLKNAARALNAMKKTIYSSKQKSQQCPAEQTGRPRAALEFAGGQPGQLAQLSQVLNQSSLVQRQLGLASTLNNAAQPQAVIQTAPMSNSSGMPVQLMGSRAKHYIDEFLATQVPVHTYDGLEGRLTPGEIAELELIWTNQGVGKKPPRQKRAGEAIGRRLLQIIATLRQTVLAYQSNFDTKHVHDGDVSSATAVDKGNARDPKPAWNTVFKKSYLEGLVAGAADGDYNVVRRASDDGDGNIGLAELRVANQTYKQAALGIYQYRLRYSVATDWTTRTKTITFTHMETA
jgi:hypothetical protein